MNWRLLYFGKLNKEETLEAVKDKRWQELRVSLKGKSLHYKYYALMSYLRRGYEDLMEGYINKKDLKNIKIRVTNYVTALSRGGLIKPSDYR